MSNELNEDELKIKIQQVEDKVKSLRKIEGDSDLSHRIEGLHAQFSYAYSQNPRFAGVVLKIGSHRTIQRKIIHFKNWERDLDEKCEWLAEKLDAYVGHNQRQREYFKENLAKQNIRAKSIHKNLEAYGDGKGVHGKVKLHDISLNYNLTIGNVSDELAKVILEVIENYKEKTV